MSRLMEDFFNFIEERYLIWYHKEVQGQPSPWTSDPILQEYRFTNVRREDDRVTIWVRKHIREAYAEHPNLWFMLCLARQINWPESLQAIMDAGYWPDNLEHWNELQAAVVLDDRMANKQKVYTGAYMIRAESDPNKSWYCWSKQQYMMAIVLGVPWKERKTVEPVMHTSIQEATEMLSTFHGWGPFMSYQVAVDLTWTHYLENAPDMDSWAALGPGSKRGLNRLHNRGVKDPLSQEQGLQEMVDLYENQWLYLNTCPELRLSDIQNCLCEFDKYLRVKNGEGRPRAHYIEGRGY